MTKRATIVLALTLLAVMLLIPIHIFFIDTNLLFFITGIIIAIFIMIGYLSSANMFYLYGKARMGRATHDEIEKMELYMVFVLLGYLLSLFTYIIPSELHPNEFIADINHTIAIVYMTSIPMMKIVQDIETIRSKTNN